MKLAIIGVGLIGGSLGLALKKALGADIEIWGLCRTEKTKQCALARGAIDKATTDIKTAVENADVVYLATPVLQMPSLVQKILPYLKKGAILTDAGSTKTYIWEHIRTLLPPDVYYVAGHPMTGREKSGVMAAQADLFQNKAYVILEGTGAPKEAVEKLLSLLQHTGANFLHLDIKQHDRCASVISHVPHLVAASLVTLLQRRKDDLPACLKLAGGGFKDTTRIASSDADMWADIAMTNGEAIAHDLREVQHILGELIVAMERKDRAFVHDYFIASKECRAMVLDATEKMYDLE